MPADSRCENVFEIAGAKHFRQLNRALTFFQDVSGHFSNFSFHFSFRFFRFGIQNLQGEFRSADVPL